MILAKIALGLGGTIVLAGAYTFHDGIMRVDVDENRGNTTHVHVWLPAAVVPMAMHFVPKQKMQCATEQAREWLPTLRALTKELERYPETQLVEVRDSGDHVSVRTHRGKLLIDVSEPGEQVHVACPFAMLEDVSRELEAAAPRL